MNVIPDQMKWPAEPSPRRITLSGFDVRARAVRALAAVAAPGYSYLVIAGASILVAGVGLISLPAAVIIAGALVLLLGIGGMRA